MDFFIMSQNKRISNAARAVAGSPKIKNMNREELAAMPDTMLLYVEEDRHNEYPDYIEELGVVSGKLKRIMSKYQKDILFKTVVLIEKSNNRQQTYYYLSAPEIQSAVTVQKNMENQKNRENKLILDEEKIGQTRIFSVQHYGKRLIVRLDAAESILRRDSYGVWFEKV